jgi:integrase
VELPAWSWHNLRHKWTTESAAQGMSMLMIMYNLGHTNYQTTQGYLNMLGISDLDFNNSFDFLGDIGKNETGDF